MNNIYNIAITRPHNLHYLKRYLKFIEARKDRSLLGYKEAHHILPKAKDMFHEYENLVKHPWNKIFLTAREHIIAHILLWKAYGGSQGHAVWSMLTIFNASTNTWLRGREVPYSMLKYVASSREASIKFKSLFNTGKAKYKDKDGNIFTLRTDDPRIEAEGLVGVNRGIPHSPEALENIRAAAKLRIERGKLKRIVYLYKGSQKIKLRVSDAAYPGLIEDGWVGHRTPQDLAEAKARRDLEMSKVLKGTMRYCRPDGTFFARISMDDPRIKELGLIPQVTEKQRSIARSNASLMSQANTGTTIYNDGVTEIKRLVHPGEGWVEGRLPRSDEYKTAHADGVRARVKGSTTWNDGHRNYRLLPNQKPEAHWVKGMAPRRLK